MGEGYDLLSSLFGYATGYCNTSLLITKYFITSFLNSMYFTYMLDKHV